MNNTGLYMLLLIPIFSLLFIVSALIKNRGKIKTSNTYSYERKRYLLTKPENDFFKILKSIISDQYYVFPQIHLGSLLEHQVVGQNWKAALSHIDRKSIDYVICDKTYLSPLLAIELDDSTHSRNDRRDRDHEVERILEIAKLPLIRIPYAEIHNTERIGSEITKILEQGIRSH